MHTIICLDFVQYRIKQEEHFGGGHLGLSQTVRHQLILSLVGNK